MAESQISRVLIPCLAIQLKNTQFIYDDNVVGKILNVPCRDSFVDELLYWFVPIKDDGIFTGLQIIPADANNPVGSPPTFDSILTQRIRDKLSNSTWWVYVDGDTPGDQFKTSCNTCCGADAIPMPGTTGGFKIEIAPCQAICDSTDANGNYISTFGLPTLESSPPTVYFPYGSYNNVALTAASSSGYATVGDLLTFLNGTSLWNTFVWTASADNLTLVATGGSLGDSLCVEVLAVTPSP